MVVLSVILITRSKIIKDVFTERHEVFYEQNAKNGLYEIH